jgi:hypothetical protein
MLYEDIKKSLSARDEDIARSIMATAGMNDANIEKAISTGTGLVAYDLQAPAKNLYPVNTPIIKSLPRVGGGSGVATNWKVVSAITGSGFDNTAWVPEGQRAGQMGYTTAAKAANYSTIGEEDQATFEAISAGVGFEDIRARMTTRLLQKMMLKEEAAMLFGNADLALGTPATPTLAAAGSGATLPALTYSVIVVALTMEGYRNTALSALATGIPTSKVITGADGKTFTLNGGSSIKSAAATQAVTLGQTLSCTVTAIQGAAAYAWFVGAAGAEKLEKVTTINSATFSAPLAGTGQAATTVGGSDFSANASGFNGLLTTALKSGSGAYINALATGTAGTGTVLTASGKGSVNEIDQLMQTMWDNSQCSVSVLYVNSQEIRNITTKVLSSGSAPLLQYFQDPAKGEYALTAGGNVEFYYNPYLNKKIPIRVHPNIAPGTILGFAETSRSSIRTAKFPTLPK